MSYDDILKQTAVQTRAVPQQQHQPGRGQYGYDDGGYYDPYPVPGDPYMYRPPQQNANMQMLNALLDTKLKTGEELDNMMQMFVILMDSVRRIPNVEMTVIKSLQRDWFDIVFLSTCQGQKQRTLDKMKDLLFEINSLGAYGGAELRGISTVGAMITQKQIADQTVKYPQDVAKRQKLFGII